MKKLLTTTITCLLIFLVFKTEAQTSNLSIQGVLRTAEGDAVDNGEYNLTFRLYLEANTGNNIWEETIEGVNVKGGIYSVILGAGDTPLDAAFDQTYFLGVSVEGGIEMIPRAKLTSSPYALSLIGDDNVFPNSGNVGVGSADPQSKLTIARENATLGLEAEEGANNNAAITTKPDGLEFSTEGTNNAYYFAGEITEVMRIKKNGKVNIEGQLGIGTNDPQSPLHVVGDNDQIKIEGTNNAKLIFSKNSGSGTIGFTQATGNDFLIDNNTGNIEINATNIELNPSSGNTLVNSQIQINKEGETLQLFGSTNTHLTFYPKGITNGKKGEIGINTSGQLNIESTDSDVILKPNGTTKRVYTYGMFHALGYEAHHFSGHVKERLPGSPYAIRPSAEWNNIGIWSNQGVHAPFFIISSDKRIKKDFHLSDNQKDLQVLSNLEVTNYRHIDEVAKGKEIRKGLIAQQVKNVFPEAVTMSTGFIPNIYDFPASVTKKNESLKIRLSKTHDLKIGDKIQILTSGGKQEFLVATIISPQEFKINNWNGSDKKEALFIYGKEVHDFHTVDYDRIFTLNVSATQELTKKVKALEKENKQLKNKVYKSEVSNSMLKTELKTFSTRLEKIEDYFNSTSSN